MKRRVLILATWYPSAASPVNGIFVQEQARVLSTQYDVVVLAPQLATWRDVLKRRLVAPSVVEHREGIAVYREHAIAPGPTLPQLTYRYYLHAVRRGFGRVLETWGTPDIIHAHVVLPGGWAATELGKTHKIPVVMTEHSSPFSMHLSSSYQRQLVRETLEYMDQIVAISPAMAEQIQAYCDTVETTTIGEVINTSFFTPTGRDGHLTDVKTRFLTVALLSPQKGIHHLLEAAKNLVDRGVSAFEVMIGGDGMDRAILEEQVRRLGLTERCHFLGLLTPARVRQEMQQCDVFLLPSMHETFGIVLGEAMACGKPVISTRCGGPEYVVTPDTGVLVEVANPIALADAMEEFIAGRLCFNPQRVRDSVTERFGEAAFLANISSVYQQVWTKN